MKQTCVYRKAKRPPEVDLIEDTEEGDWLRRDLVEVEAVAQDVQNCNQPRG